jgi:phosphoenolpyruvate-protein kinase (PTS system EI component)
LPLAIVPEHVVESIVDDEWVVVDANETEARVWIAPSEAFLAEARGKRNAQIAEAKEIGLASLDKLDHLGVAVRVNIGALSEGIPQGADGVGLVRTELLFAGRRHPPDEADLVHAFASIAKAAAPAPTVIRLYDAGGDKPLDWLPAPADDPGARGIALLLRHPEMLKAQLRAAGLLEREHDIRVLIPLTRGAEDVHAVRDLAPPHLRNKVGAMIETLDAVDQSDAIARASDFVCIGTNDLSSFLGAGEPLVGSRVLTLVSRVLCAAKAHSRAVTVCGEMAGDSLGARVLVGVGVDALSVSPSKVPSVKATLRRATRESCREDAERLLGRTIS